MKNYVSALILGIGIALAGYFVESGINNFAHKDRVVSVKGLSEREVMADKVTWSLSVDVSGNQLENLYEQLKPKEQKLIDFLKEHGVTDDEIVRDAPSVNDNIDDYNWAERAKQGAPRYSVTGSLTVVSNDVQKIVDLHMNQLDLLKMGVLPNGYISYDYSGLNSLKPEMVEEATVNARAVGQKFAADAGCSLGSICSARQGQFEVESDDVMPYKRHIRVVTSIEYYLK